ncbi:M20 metallopeptidase family protein [Alicyclobacillus macrosporangiidus]|uniref:M20 metallopeptidase family protein n=1 Tax=Alicyclobacillus macrosporangiidus TaxID=392015 RepID=UPI0004984686|nr:amidohydrolase [Alicyclobacillus macrosporangiidus]
MNISEQVNTLVQSVYEDVVKWRRFLHANPELSFQEVNTSQFVYDTLLTFGDMEVSRPTKTSVVARLVGVRPGKTLALRADMDALPIVEETGLDFASTKHGVMHACGHDGHTAILLGVARVLTQLRTYLAGEVRFVFQHAEESHPGGAVELVRSGVMDGVDYIVGLHLWSLYDVGEVHVSAGYTTASSDRFNITIIGQGGHASMPHDTVDSVAIAAQVISNLQHIVSRNVDPLKSLVISVTKVQAGDGYNVIPPTVTIGGTVRAFDQDVLESVPKWLERTVRGVTAAHGATYQFEYRKGYAPVVNDPALTEKVRQTLTQVFGTSAVRNARPIPIGEDFSGYLQKAPGSFIWVGAGDPKKGTMYPHHHPRFWIDERSLAIGMKALANIAFKILNESEGV